MEEPSLLDYLKAKLTSWRKEGLRLPTQLPEVETTETVIPPQAEEVSPGEATTEFPMVQPEAKPAARVRFPWLSLLALILALAAQHSFAPRPYRSGTPGVLLLAASVALVTWASLRGEWKIAALPEATKEAGAKTLNVSYLVVGVLFAIATYLSFAGLQFNYFNLALVVISAFFVSRAFWQPTHKGLERLKSWLLKPTWSLRINRQNLLSLFVIVWVLFFRFYRLEDVPPEMNSDHAEKLLDSFRVLAGQTNIFFPNNGGREALHMYLVAALHRFFHVELDFTALKIASSAVGALALVFIYLLGKEIGNRRIGLLAFLLAGIAYWPNVVSRFGLRLPFYMLFTASTLYFLLRGLRNGNRNEFLWAGISLGLSFYGYTADRILPLVILVAIGLFLIHPHAKNRRHSTLVSLIGLILVSFVLFLPLLRYIIEEPQGFFFRTFTRMGSMERELPAPVWQVFLSNTWRALKMFSWSGGVVWPISIPEYPALSVVPGGLFYLGVVLLLIRYVRQRHWFDLFLLLSIPLLMLPSILSLAFPEENPNLYRTGGAFVPVFLMIAIALDGLMSSIVERSPSRWGSRLAGFLALLLVAWSSLQDYNLVFNRYFEQYQRSAWNSSEMGQVIRHFNEMFGNPDAAWVMGYPHWVDTRLVGINAGRIGKDYALFVDQLGDTTSIPAPKLFLVKPEDQSAISALSSLYPQGWFSLYSPRVPTKEFLFFFVPAQGGGYTPATSP